MSLQWLPQDSLSRKNRQRGSTFKSLNAINDHEKSHFSKPRAIYSQLIRAKNYLYFFEKCLKHGVSSDIVNVRAQFQVAFKTSKFTKDYNDLNKNTRN